MWQKIKFWSRRGPQIIARHIPIAGLQYYRAADLVGLMRCGDTLELVPEPDNPHDPHAIVVLWRRNKIGYMPGEQARRLRGMLGRHLNVKGRIVAICPERGLSKWLECDVYEPQRVV